jgi:hypothetical protein
VVVVDRPRLAVARFARPGLTPLGAATTTDGSARLGGQ